MKRPDRDSTYRKPTMEATFALVYLSRGRETEIVAVVTPIGRSIIVILDG